MIGVRFARTGQENRQSVLLLDVSERLVEVVLILDLVVHADHMAEGQIPDRCPVLQRIECLAVLSDTHFSNHGSIICGVLGITGDRRSHVFDTL